MKKLILLVGNIGSGKSTIAKKYAKKNYRIISRDSIRYMVGAGNYVFDVKLEPTIKQATESLLKEFLYDKVSVVYDETNVSKRLRESTIKIAKRFGYKVTAIVLPKLTKNESVNRRMRSPHGNYSREIWETVWENFNSIYEEPTKDEGIDEVIKL